MSKESDKTKIEVERYFEQTENGESPRVLPTFKGYTVDVRLQQFRKAKFPAPIEFVPFDSPKGKRLLAAMAKILKE